MENHPTLRVGQRRRRRPRRVRSRRKSLHATANEMAWVMIHRQSPLPAEVGICIFDGMLVDPPASCCLAVSSLSHEAGCSCVDDCRVHDLSVGAEQSRIRRCNWRNGGAHPRCDVSANSSDGDDDDSLLFSTTIAYITYRIQTQQSRLLVLCIHHRRIMELLHIETPITAHCFSPDRQGAVRRGHPPWDAH